MQPQPSVYMLYRAAVLDLPGIMCDCGGAAVLRVTIPVLLEAVLLAATEHVRYININTTSNNFGLVSAPLPSLVERGQPPQ